MFNFSPEESKPVKVPRFEDARRDEGWQGYSTTKSVRTLQLEITEAIRRLGGTVMSFQRGTYHVGDDKRDGFQIHYSIQSSSGSLVPGRLDIAALPVRKYASDVTKDKSLRMALYMVRMAIDGLWFLQQLSPGYAPLMPWMIVNGNKTVTELWSESSAMNRLLPPGGASFEEGEVVSG